MLTLPNLYCALALWDRPVRLVVSHRNDPNRSRKGEPFDSLSYLVHLRADLVTANSSSAVETIRRSVELRDEDVRLASNVADVMPQGLSDDAHRFLVVGRLVPHKRVDLAIRSFAAMADEAEGWRLVIAGEGPKRQELSELAAALGVASRVDLLGYVTPITELLRPGGVLINLSEYEGTPNAMMEAMAMGIPCITTDSSPGPVDLLLSGDAPAGIICREGQDAEIVTAMLKLSGDAAYRARLGKAGFESVASQGWDALRGPWSEILDLRSRAPD